ncbi:g6605 [Coccomyxa viridis]|uniref:G6605 protein n=1 Tax=Coccomyxa viridis TaxID=1274662 RepID=A0ABP1G2A9_9CHLO
MERKIALCVSQWSADSTLYAWSYAKQYFLRKRRDAQGVEVLSPLDKLYVVHVFKDGRKEREKEGSKWCAGGPLLPAMATALAKFPHQIVELEGQSVHQSLLEFGAKENVDIMILGDKEHKGTVQRMVQPGGIGHASTSDTIKSKSKRPCLVVRPASARNEKMRIKSNINLGSLLGGSEGVFDGAISSRLKAMAPTTAVDEVRKVCLAFESMDVGQQMLAWATKFCLFPDDEVYIVHCLSKSLMKLSNKKGNEVGPEIVEDIEREQVNVVSNTQLKDDAKQGLVDFLEENNIDLVITGTATTSRFRKTLNLGQSSLSSHLLHHGPCPTLVIPFKSMNSEGSVPEGALPMVSPDGAVEMSPRESMDTPAPAPPAYSAFSGHRRTSVDKHAGSSPAAYPLTITSDGEDEDGQAGPHSGSKPGRTTSLRQALQSWRGIQKAIGRTGSGNHFASDDGEEGQESSRRSSRTLPAMPDLESSQTAQLRRQLQEQTNEIAALKEQVRQLQSMLPSASRRPEAAAAAGALPPPSPIREPTEPPAAAS